MIFAGIVSLVIFGVAFTFLPYRLEWACSKLPIFLYLSAVFYIFIINKIYRRKKWLALAAYAICMTYAYLVAFRVQGVEKIYRREFVATLTKSQRSDNHGIPRAYYQLSDGTEDYIDVGDSRVLELNSGAVIVKRKTHISVEINGVTYPVHSIWWIDKLKGALR